MNLYLALAAITVTVHTSVPSPTHQNPHRYGLTTCTGVFVGPDEILTAGHCVSESRGHQWIKTFDNKSISVTIKKLDKHKDLALLKVTKPINHAYTSLGNPVIRGDAVYTVNSGGEFERTYNTGMVNNLITEESTLTILHSALMMFGASGSGLFNSQCQIVGINVANVQNFSEAVDVREIKAFLDPRL